MEHNDQGPTRRDALKLGSVAVGAVVAQMAAPGFVFPGQDDDEQLLPFLGMPRTPPNRLDWEMLTDWLTPQDQVFSVQHYGIPDLSEEGFSLQIAGLVDKPTSFPLTDLKGFPKQDQLMTLECSGNGASKGFMNAVYNSRWSGTPLAPLLRAAGIKKEATEVVFFGVDRQTEVLRKGTPRETSVHVPFGRSLSVDQAMGLNLLLAYERNGEPLERRNGGPLRLIVPGWYGIANVKWLQRIEVRDRRYEGRFMGRDYVTVRGKKWGDEVVFLETSVGPMNLKSIVARVTHSGGQADRRVKAYGAVWGDGTPIDRVEVRVDDGPWRVAELAAEPRSKFCWTFFSIDLGSIPAGQHTVVSRAVDAQGRVQPSADEDEIALKRTYWEAYQQWPREIEVPEA